MSRTARRIRTLAFVLGLLAAIAVVVDAAVDANSSRYGQVPAPGSATLELPEGDVTLFYEIRGQRDLGGSAPNLSIRVAPAGGGSPLPLGAPDVDESYSDDSSSKVSLAKVEVPAAGDYRVRVSRPSDGLTGGSVTFGDGVGAAVLDSAGTAAAILGGTIALVVAITLIDWIRRRIAVEDEGPALPPGAGDRGTEVGSTTGGSDEIGSTTSDGSGGGSATGDRYRDGGWWGGSGTGRGL